MSESAITATPSRSERYRKAIVMCVCKADSSNQSFGRCRASLASSTRGNKAISKAGSLGSNASSPEHSSMSRSSSEGMLSIHDILTENAIKLTHDSSNSNYAKGGEV